MLNLSKDEFLGIFDKYEHELDKFREVGQFLNKYQRHQLFCALLDQYNDLKTMQYMGEPEDDE
jgi:hypothetical protein